MGSSGNYSGPTGNIGFGTGVGATGPIPAAPASSFSGAAAGAGGLSLAAAGLSAYSTVLQGQGQNAADEYKAEALERSAQAGDVKAAQTGAQLNEKLNNNLGNIDTVRAAAHADPTTDRRGDPRYRRIPRHAADRHHGRQHPRAVAAGPIRRRLSAVGRQIRLDDVRCLRCSRGGESRWQRAIRRIWALIAMTFPRSEEIIEALREQHVDEARPIIRDGIEGVRDQLVREGLIDPSCLQVALRAFADSLRERWAHRITDPPLRQALMDELDAMVRDATQADRHASTLQ